MLYMLNIDTLRSEDDNAAKDDIVVPNEERPKQTMPIIKSPSKQPKASL